MSPIANALRRPGQRREPELFYPLCTYVCSLCKLVQLEAVQTRETHFHGDYAYFSSYSTSWLTHAETYAAMMTNRFSLGPSDLVVEVASNDGYLLQYFKARGIGVIGIDPAVNCAQVARDRHGILTLTRFFGVDLAREMAAKGHIADVLVANNVLAHVPDLNDFVAGLKILLKSDGVITIEFPHFLQLLEANYFDTIYHEHYSYLSLLALERLFERHQLEIFDLEELSTHGGSLRVFAKHSSSNGNATSKVIEFRNREAKAGLDHVATYSKFSDKAEATKRDLLKLLISIKSQGSRIAGYGAPAKGNTLLNYCGIRSDFLDFTVDANPHKQGLYLPGTGIPIFAPEHVLKCKPDFLLILPWNLKDEIMQQMSDLRSWGGRFLVSLPKPAILD